MLTRQECLDQLDVKVKACTKCNLCNTRKNTVLGTGNTNPTVMFVGEGPGEDEDEQGLPFVGKAGVLLNEFIQKLGFKREEVYIANVLKCRPPDNRQPTQEEVKACLPYLKLQIKLLKPKFIVCLGTTAAQALLESEARISNLRGRWHKFGEIDVIATYHPSYVLRNPIARREVFKDFLPLVDKLYPSE